MTADSSAAAGWLAALPEANPNIIVIMTCPDRIAYVNPTGRQWLEARSLDSVDGIRALLPDGYGALVCNRCDRTERQQWTVEHEERVYDVRTTPLTDRSRCMLTINDVTEFRRLTREHEVFYRAFRAARSAIMVTDVKGRIEFVNEHFESLYGYQPASVIGRTPRVVGATREDYCELGFSDAGYDELFAGMWHAILDPAVGYWEGELPNRTADGRIVWVHLLVQAVRDEAGSLTGFIGLPVDITDSRNREHQIRLEIYEAISDLAELRDNETGNHIKRVGLYARQLAERLGQSRRFQEEILSFAPLHDIGKVGIPDEILLAPRPLVDAEFELMKRHTVLGYELLRGKPTLEMAAEIAYGHHERWDGAGYPLGTAGPAIPLSARIVAVCDVYDALRSVRPYKVAWDHDRTVAEIAAGREKQFDPDIIDAFLSCEGCVRAILDLHPDR